MTEYAPNSADTQNNLHELNEVLDASFASLSEQIPELRDNPEILSSVRELVEEFEIKPSFFSEPARGLLLSGIAARWAKSAPDDVKEKTYVADIVTLLAHEHSDLLAEFSEQVKLDNEEFDDATRVRVYDRYTDRALSDEIQEMMSSGLIPQIEATKERLGITAENEDEYTIRVLSIADENDTNSLSAPAPDYSLGIRSSELAAQVQLKDDVKAWKKGLIERNMAFARELGVEEQFAPAWVTVLDGHKTLCISTALAEKIRDPQVIENSPLASQGVDRDVAVLAHEYTHTQGGVTLDGGVTFGINAEELRAEHFSGDRHGYQDIKRFFAQYRIITGHSVKDGFDTRVKGGTSTEVLGDIANRVGLARMVDLALASPKNYIEHQSNVFIKEAYNYMGGFDGVLEGIYQDEVAAGRAEDIKERLEESARVIAEGEQRNPGLIDMFENMTVRFGLSFMTRKLTARAREIYRQEAA